MLLRSCCCENAKFCVFKKCSKTCAKSIVLNYFGVILCIVHLANCDNSLEIRILFEMSYAILMKFKNQQIKRSSPVEVILVAICGSRLWRRDADKVVEKENFHDF